MNFRIFAAVAIMPGLVFPLGRKAIDMVSRQTLLRDRYMQENPDLTRAYIQP